MLLQQLGLLTLVELNVNQHIDGLYGGSQEKVAYYTTDHPFYYASEAYYTTDHPFYEDRTPQTRYADTKENG